MMPDIPSLPIASGLPPLPPDAPHPDTGVKFTVPPAHIFRDAMERIDIALAGFTEGEGAIVGISTDAGWNAAIAGKTKYGIEVYAWVGANWGEKIDYGVTVRKKFKIPL